MGRCNNWTHSKLHFMNAVLNSPLKPFPSIAKQTEHVPRFIFNEHFSNIDFPLTRDQFRFDVTEVERKTCDEAHFWLNGYVNKQNCRIWSEANPQVYVETPFHPEKLIVWCALWAGGILQKR
ncbi:hypothetical protein TNCV_1654731 [Trichonephila clavipes]|nr:hypothetical protein TNCV_1654731 [Trichonephila clavipes]